MQTSNTFTINVIFCLSRSNTWRLKNIFCYRSEPKQRTDAWQIWGVKPDDATCRYKQRKSCRRLWPLKKLPKHDLTTPISPYNTTWSALHKQEWSDKKVQRPKRKRQMNKCLACVQPPTLLKSVLLSTPFYRIFQQENKANFLVPIDFCNSSRFCCKLFLFLRRPWHIYYKCTVM